MALTAEVPHAGATHGGTGGPAYASGDSASETAAASTLGFAMDLARPDLPRPRAVSATGIQALLIWLQIRR